MSTKNSAYFSINIYYFRINQKIKCVKFAVFEEYF